MTVSDLAVAKAAKSARTLQLVVVRVSELHGRNRRVALLGPKKGEGPRMFAEIVAARDAISKKSKEVRDRLNFLQQGNLGFDRGAKLCVGVWCNREKRMVRIFSEPQLEANLRGVVSKV